MREYTGTIYDGCKIVDRYNTEASSLDSARVNYRQDYDAWISDGTTRPYIVWDSWCLE